MSISNGKYKYVSNKILENDFIFYEIHFTQNRLIQKIKSNLMF